MLDKAKTVEEILKIEIELERINEKINRTEGRLKYITQSVDLALLSINLEEKVKPGIVGAVFYYLGKGVKWLFVIN